jgi:hypothetical protein
MQGMSQSQAANYNAQVARNNQVLAQQNAKLAIQEGGVQEQAQRQKTSQLIGAEVAQGAASGVNPNTGSALNVRSSAGETGELDALTIRYNAQLAARNALIQGSSFGAQAGLYSAQSDWAVANSILGGASSVSDKWLKYNQFGISGFNFNTNQPANPLMTTG